MEERENKREETASDAELQRLVEDFITQTGAFDPGKKGCVGQGGISAGGRKTYRSILSFPGNEKEKTFKII